ncbi:MAG: NmrA family NAD(P)-binding protein [Marinilabiliales bacterium]|nr:NmrA family NAD(P)-binding protein [Marinilabiliales bacterium]
MERILVTGATGNVGLSTVKFLLDREMPDVEVVAAVRDLKQAGSNPLLANARLVNFEFDEPDTYAAALQGVTKLLLIRPNQVSDVSKHIFPFLDQVEKSGIRHIVFVSIIGAERSKVFANHRIEAHLKKMSIPHTIVRPSLYMQNLLWLHGQEIRQNDKIYIPAGAGMVNYIDARDVARVVVKLLTEPGYEGKEFELTGDEPMDFYTIAHLFTRELGREIRYARPLTIKFIRQKLREKKSMPFIVTLSLLYGSARNGKMAHVSEDFNRLLGSAPNSLANFIHEYRSFWGK